MKVHLESTTKLVTLVTDGGAVPARIWEGVTEGGVRCHAYITRIAGHQDDDLQEFERELEEQRVPSTELLSIPARLIL